MNPLVVGNVYHLRLPGGTVLGQVCIRRMEDGWAEGDFLPTAKYADFQALFEEEARLRKDQVIPLWEEAADRIETLHIEVVGERGDVHFPMRIFLEGADAFLAPPLTAMAEQAISPTVPDPANR